MFTFTGEKKSRKITFTLNFKQWLVIWLNGHVFRKKNIGELVAKRHRARGMDAECEDIFVLWNVHQMATTADKALNDQLDKMAHCMDASESLCPASSLVA